MATTEVQGPAATDAPSRRLRPARRLGVWTAARRASPRDTALRLLVLAGAVAQCAMLVARSRAQWDDYSLTIDFAVFHQAWWLLGHGHLSPFDTIGGHLFWKDQFNLTFWPFGLLWPVSHSSFTLLVAQDVTIALASLVAGWWACDAVETRLRGRVVTATAVILATIAALVLDPWAFETAYFDYHAEPLAALFLLLAGRALWRGRRFSPYLWGLLAMASCTAGATLAFGLGAGAATTGGGRWRRGVVLAGIAIAFTALVVVLGANSGTRLGPTYGYLAGGKPVGNGLSGALAIAGGVVTHPGTAWHVLWSRRRALSLIFTAGGVLGVLTGWGAGVALVDVLTNGLNSAPSFTSLISGGFQNFPAVLFVLVGSALAACWLLDRERRFLLGRDARPLRWLGRRAGSVVGVLVGLAALSTTLVLAAHDDGGMTATWLRVPPASARQVGRILGEVPTSWEVAVSQGIAGRFGGRSQVYAYEAAHQTVPLITSRVLFVVAPAVGIEPVAAPVAWAAVHALIVRYHGRVIARRAGVWAIVVQRAAVPGHLVQLPPRSPP